jgi:hypothetical protein
MHYEIDMEKDDTQKTLSDWMKVLDTHRVLFMVGPSVYIASKVENDSGGCFDRICVTALTNSDRTYVVYATSPTKYRLFNGRITLENER